MSFYILQEDGASHLLLEDGSGALLIDPPTGLDSFFWLPVFPDRIPPGKYPHSKHWEEQAAVFVPKTIPIPDLLHDHWFLPEFPDRIPPTKTPHEQTEATSPALTNVTVLTPLGWLPVFPDHPQPQHAFPVRQGFADATPPLYPVVVPGQLGWLPAFPDRIPHDRSAHAEPMAYRTYPPFIAALVTCWQLGLERVTSSTLTPETTTTSDLIAEGLASTGLIAETLC